MIDNAGLFTAEGLAGLVFLVVIAATLLGAFITIYAKRLIHSVSGLAISFIGVAGIYYYLYSPFVAFMEMLIYVGAVCVTIAFAIMLAEPTSRERTEARGPVTAVMGILVGSVIFWGLASLASNTPWMAAGKRITNGSIGAVGNSLLTTYSMVFELVSVVLIVAIIGSLVLARPGRGR